MRKISSASFLAVAVILAGANVWGDAVTLTAAPHTNVGGDRQTSFDDGWKFRLGDVQNAADPKMNDADWRSLNVPHDYAIEGVVGKDAAAMEGPFDPKSPSGAGGGSLNAGVAWYRKTFSAESWMRGKRVAIDFGGVYMNSDVYLNGKLLGNHPYGYTPFEYDLTEGLNFGGPNVIAVRCNVEQPSSRWYSGAGIYRDVSLVTTDPVHIAHDGVWINPKDAGNEGYVATVRTVVRNDSDQPQTVRVWTDVRDPAGALVATYKPVSTNSKLSQGMAYSEDQVIPAHGEATVSAECRLPFPTLWSVETPRLYSAVTQVRVGEAATDSVTTKFGLRTIEFTKDNGFLLNGKRVQIQGVCDHHDLGCLGSAVNHRALERQLELLKAMGCNAIRTSHNPPDTALLDLADSMGFLVMDEAFDEWKQSKTKYGYGRFFDKWSEPDLVTMIHRDRNHPSIVLWSIGNEIKEQGGPAPKKGAPADATPEPVKPPGLDTYGGPMATRLADIAHREDPSRPVTSACNSAPAAVKSGFADALDVFGLNYRPAGYKTFKGRVLVASETASALSTRGEYGLKLNADGKVDITIRPPYQCTSYDLDKPGWGSTAETSILAVRSAPWVAGEFVWTGFDYIGEPTPYKYPSRSSYFGIIDLAGFPKDRYYIYQSQWQTKPMVHLLPHWNWKGFEGKEIPVQAYTTGDSAELFLNGKSQGVRDFKNNQTLHLEWKVPYEPGTLKVVAKKDGKEIATEEVTTAGEPARLEMIPDRGTITADSKDLSFVTVRVVDKDGHICPDADNEISFSVNGSAAIAGVDNGDPTNHESFQGAIKDDLPVAAHKAFHGLALIVIRSEGVSGQATVNAEAKGLDESKAVITLASPATP